MYRYDADELETLANGVVAAIRKYGIPVKQLTDQQIWEELQKNGYRFPVRAKFGDMTYDTIDKETAWWFEVLQLAIKQVRKTDQNAQS